MCSATGSKVVHELMLDSCGGHAFPCECARAIVAPPLKPLPADHYHNDNACDYDHSLKQHSVLIGIALDGHGIYGLYESYNETSEEQVTPDDLDACNGHTHGVPANATYGVDEAAVYARGPASAKPPLLFLTPAPRSTTTRRPGRPTRSAASAPSSPSTSARASTRATRSRRKASTSASAARRRRFFGRARRPRTRGAAGTGIYPIYTPESPEGYCYDADCPCFEKSADRYGRNSNLTVAECSCYNVCDEVSNTDCGSLSCDAMLASGDFHCADDFCPTCPKKNWCDKSCGFGACADPVVADIAERRLKRLFA